MADNTDIKITSKTSNKEFESLLVKDFKDNPSKYLKAFSLLNANP